jgi:hypothetical protein
VKRACALLLPLLLVIACRTPSVPGLLIPPDDPRPGRLLRSLEERAQVRSALRASTKMTLDAPDLSFNRPQRMAVARPASLRIEILGLFNQLAAVLVTDGVGYQLYDTRNGELQQGLVTESLLWDVARVDLRPDEAVELLLGAPVPSNALGTGPAREWSDGRIEIEQRDGAGVLRRRFAFGADENLAELHVLDERGQLVWRARFRDYRELEGPDGSPQPFAFDVRLEFPRFDAVARFRFKSVKLSAELAPELFVLELPAEASRLRGRGGGPLL